MMALVAFIFLLSSLSLSAAGNPNAAFQGGSIQWDVKDFDTTKNTYNVTFTYSFAWTLGHGPCGTGCSTADVGKVGKFPGPEVFVCDVGCSGRQVLSNPTYTVAAISQTEQWELGKGSFWTVFNSTGLFNISIEGMEWIPLNVELSGTGRMQTELNLGLRSDTNLPNRSPVVLNSRIYHMMVGCKIPIKIFAMDSDVDRVRCRWASTPKECGGVCGGLPGAILYEDSCTVDVNAVGSYGYGMFAASIMVEDFPYSDVTINGEVFNDRKPFSSVPTQFLLYYFPNNAHSCGRPEFINHPWAAGQVEVVKPGHTFTETLCAKPSQNEIITDIIVQGPDGMTHNKVGGQLPGSICVYVEWIPTNQTSPGLVCVTAEQSNKMHSIPHCLTLRVDDKDDCVGVACPSGLTCIDGQGRYVCVNLTASNNNHTEITAGICLQRVLDLVFLLDSSYSLTQSDKSEMRKFLSEVVKDFGVGQYMTRIGVVVYDDNPHLIFNLNTHLQESEVLKEISNMTFGYGGSDTGAALKFVQEQMFTPINGDRHQVPNVVVVVTDGHSRDSYATQFFAKEARNTGISIFAIGIGPHINMKELESMASVPDDKYVFTVNSYSDLHQISERMSNTTCTVRLPNTTSPIYTTPRPGCYNRNENCLLYGESVCTDYPGWSSDNCALWCEFCPGTTTLPPCMDNIPDCTQYGFDVCTKPSLRHWAMENCRAYCGFPPCLAPATTPTTTPKPTTPGICADHLDNCVSYGKGVCKDPSYTGWVNDNCKAFCGRCVEYVEVPEQIVNGILCPAWKLPSECFMDFPSSSCCPLPSCPIGFKNTVEKPDI